MNSNRLSKLAVAIGGFLIFVGIMMLSVSALAFTRAVDLSVLPKEYLTLVLWTLSAIGVLDVVSGIILRRR